MQKSSISTTMLNFQIKCNTTRCSNSDKKCCNNFDKHISILNKRAYHLASSFQLKGYSFHSHFLNKATSLSLNSLTTFPFSLAYLVSATKSILIEGLLSYGLNFFTYCSTIFRLLYVLHFAICLFIRIHLHTIF